MKIIFNIGLYEILVGADCSTLYLKSKSGRQIKRCIKLPGVIQRIESHDILMGIDFHCKEKGEWFIVNASAVGLKELKVIKSVRYKKDEIMYEHKQN